MANTKKRGRSQWERDPSKEQFWRTKFAEWGRSGLTIRAFAKKHGLSEYQFYAWRRELRLRDREAAEAKGSRPSGQKVTDSRGRSVLLRQRSTTGDLVPSPGQFVPVTLQDEHSARRENCTTGGVDLHLPGGCFVRIDHDSDLSLITRILSALEVKTC